ncbi:MAG TPA: hypothetical protein PLA25_00895 [Anaerolineaceae bacterium]|nr:hypothetical protein [Anaerolineaceae bacterium]
MKKHPILVILLVMLTLGLLISIGASIRSPAPTPLPTQTPLPTPTLPQAPLPFDYLADAPEDAFLFVEFVDDNSTCLDNLCDCIQLEMAAVECEFKGDNLVLDSDVLVFANDRLIDDDNWTTFREHQQGIALYCYWSVGTSGLDLKSGFPFSTTEVIFTVLGVDALGNIQVQGPGGYTIVPVGGTVVFEQPELMDRRCKVLHIFTLSNYGFIKDADVILADY